MRSLALLAAFSFLVPLAHAQGSGAPSPAGQTDTPQAASSAEHAVAARHEKAVARSQARAAKRAKKAASAASK